MPTTRADVHAALRNTDADALRAILVAAGVSDGGATTSDELAERVANQLWWSYSTPAGYMADRATLESIVQHVARKCGVKSAVSADADAWEQLRSLTGALLHETDKVGVRIDDVDPKARVKIWPQWIPTAMGGGTAATSFGARFASGKVLALLAGRWGRLIPLVPPLAPYYWSLKKISQAVFVVSGPLGVALTFLTINEALGTSYNKLLPLLLGVGALGPQPVEDAVEL